MIGISVEWTGVGLPMSPARYKKWLVNFFILILAVALMLAMAEVAMRWLDGYQLSTFELQQDPNSGSQAE